MMSPMWLQTRTISNSPSLNMRSQPLLCNFQSKKEDVGEREQRSFHATASSPLCHWTGLGYTWILTNSHHRGEPRSSLLHTETQRAKSSTWRTWTLDIEQKTSGDLQTIYFFNNLYLFPPQLQGVLDIFVRYPKRTPVSIQKATYLFLVLYSSEAWSQIFDITSENPLVLWCTFISSVVKFLLVV